MCGGEGCTGICVIFIVEFRADLTGLKGLVFYLFEGDHFVVVLMVWLWKMKVCLGCGCGRGGGAQLLLVESRLSSFLGQVEMRAGWGVSEVHKVYFDGSFFTLTTS